ncbi:MAG: SH3 domain-containing protein [Firmicutes bacterium]|jgi:beta-N-acetylglucosaminidase|nr:SH3 domain-containing protein [Bacillota bacterium]
MIVLAFAAIISTSEAFGATKGTVSDKAGLNVRKGPGTDYSVLYALSYGETFDVLATTNDKAGEKWYRIYARGQEGYVIAKYAKVEETDDYIYNKTFEENLTAQGFPESYKEYLRKLHAAHPKWVFKAQKTGLNWNDVIAKQSIVGRNLIHESYPDSWKSKEYGAYDPSTGKYVIFDSGGYVAASESIIKYYVDPRNFLDETGIFQFMSHSYDSSTQTKSGLQSLVAGTFLAGTFPEKSTKYPTYSDVIMDAGKQSKANPYVLASMILVEQGSDGRGHSISGTENGYKGLYNFFNINAYKTSSHSAVENGLIYARTKGWTTRVKSIIEGAAYYAKEYINNNQNTQYLKKFNMMNGLSSVATHQYMTNVKGAADEASRLRQGYSSIMDTALTFNIPVYNNMPAVACSQPGKGNNDYFLKSLSVSGYSLMPAFNMYTSDYELVVPANVTSVTINAAARDSGAKVSGAGKITLTGNTTKVTVIVTSSSGATKKYNITIAKEAGSEANPTSSKYKIGKQITGVGFNTSVSTFKSNIKAPTGYTLKVTNSSGKEVTSGNVGTGMNVVLYKGGSAVKSIPVVIKGDVNGDGKLTSVDALMAKRHIIETYKISGVYFSASDINGDGKLTSVDALYMKRHIIGTYQIKN